jgi:peptidyl-prolyl cis-trans isomerase C
MRISRFSTLMLGSALGVALPLSLALAQATTPPPGTVPPGVTVPSAKPDPVVARVNGRDEHLSDLENLAQNLPEQLRNMPPNMLYPILIDQIIDRDLLVQEARKQGLQKDPAVKREMDDAADMALQNALINRAVAPAITDQALQAAYQKQIAGKPGEEEVHARHILVPTEAAADSVIKELQGGADFAALAKKDSTDPAAANGGDLGWFKKGDMLPEFSDAAFALKPGQFTTKPVHTRYGWHVIQVIERRTAPPPTFAEARDQLRQQAIQDAVQKEIEEARKGAQIERFNIDGTPVRATDQAEPPGPAGAEPPAGGGKAQ